MAVLVCFYWSGCVRYIDLPMTEAQRLLMAKPWIPAYTDSVSIDSTNTVHYYHLDARECEKQQPVFFADSFNYKIPLVCDQAVPGILIGYWQYDLDSTIGYGLKNVSDTAYLVPLRIARLTFISSDTLKLIQQSSFAQPDIYYQHFVEKIYSH